MTILREEHAESIGGVFHCFSGDPWLAKEALDLGFYLSFSGIITFRNATLLREVIRTVPDDRILIETDAPYLTPCPISRETQRVSLCKICGGANSRLEI